MPQIFQVLRCYKCLVFQVHQTKKTNKWECKMCGEKQSMKRHYGLGTGKECRMHVQKLNKIRGDNEESNGNNRDSDEDSVRNGNLCDEYSPQKETTNIKTTKNSKWSTYIDQSEEKLDSDNVSNIDGLIFMLDNPYESKYEKRNIPIKKKKVSADLLNDKDTSKSKSNLKENFGNHTFTCFKNNYNNNNMSSTYNENVVAVSNVSNTAAYFDRSVMGEQLQYTSLNENKIKECNNLYCINDNNRETKLKKPLSCNKKESSYQPSAQSYVRNSKWANYIDDNEELSNTSNEENYLNNQSISIASQDIEVLKENNKEYRNTLIDYTNMKFKEDENVEFKCFKENCDEQILRKETGDYNTKIVHQSKLSFYENKILGPEHQQENLSNIFSLCDDKDLDSVLDI